MEAPEPSSRLLEQSPLDRWAQRGAQNKVNNNIVKNETKYSASFNESFFSTTTEIFRLSWKSLIFLKSGKITSISL